MIETIKRIAEAKAVLARPVPNDMKFFAGHQLAKAEASRSLESLYKTLAEDVAQVAVPIYVRGTNARQLAEKMAELAPAAIVDVNGLYSPIVQAVKASIGRSNEFGVSQFALIIRELRQLAVDNNLAGINVPQFKEPEVVTSQEKLESLVFHYIQAAVGAELAVNYIRKQTGEEAVKVITEKTPVFPVFLLNVPAEGQELLTKKLFKRAIDVVVESPSEVTEEAALNSLKSIKKSLKNNKE